MKRAALIVCLPLLAAIAGGCQSDDAMRAEPADYIRSSAGDPETGIAIRQSHELMMEMMRHSNKMMEQEPPAPPEFFVALGAFYQAHKKWPADAAELKPFGWDRNIPIAFTTQPNGALQVVYGDIVRRTFGVFPPEPPRTPTTNGPVAGTAKQ